MFKNCFNFKRNNQDETEPYRSIQRLTQVKELLVKKVNHLESKLEQELKIIKKNEKGTTVANKAIKRKQQIENQLEQTQETLTEIEHKREALNNAIVEKEVLRVIDNAVKALKRANDGMGGAHKITELMNEVKEQQRIANEMSAIIGGNKHQDIEDQCNDEVMPLEESEPEQEEDKLEISCLKPELEPNQAMNRLDEVKEMLGKKANYLELKLEEELEFIKKNESRDSAITIGAKNRKQRIEKQLEQIQATITIIENQMEALENCMINVEVLKTMNTAAQVIKRSTVIKQDNDELVNHEALGNISKLEESEPEQVMNKLEKSWSKPESDKFEGENYPEHNNKKKKHNQLTKFTVDLILYLF